MPPIDPASRLSYRIEAVDSFPLQKMIVFSPVVEGRTYVVRSKAALTKPAWLPLGSFETAANNAERTVTDLNASDDVPFHYVEITLA